MKKNCLNPYRIESGAYYNLRKILAPKWGDGALDEYKRKHRAEIKRHTDLLEKSAQTEWRTLFDGTSYRLFQWTGETEEELMRWERQMSSQPATAGAYYYSAHVARTGRNGKNIAVILYHEIDD